MELLLALLLGACLSAAAGFRAFLPLFGLGVAARLQQDYGIPTVFFAQLQPQAQWMASDSAILCFGVATAFEVLADKVPGFDHALDLLLAWIRPVAATLASFSLLQGHGPLVSYSLAIIVGAGVSIPIQVLKAAGRAALNTLTLGTGAPLVSLLEDLGALLLIALVLAPLLALTLALPSWLFWKWLRWRAQATSPSTAG
jgi:hypothetical protein